DLIAEERAAPAIIAEEVSMIPGSERPLHLPIGEHPAGQILRVLGDPPQPQRSQADGEDDARARPDRGPTRDQGDPLPGWDQPPEGARALMEREDHLRRRRDPRFLDKPHATPHIKKSSPIPKCAGPDRIGWPGTGCPPNAPPFFSSHF